MKLFDRFKKSSEPVQPEAPAVDPKKEKLEEVMGQVMAATNEAIGKNKVYNVFRDGRVSEKIGKMQAFMTNGGKSVVVMIEDTSTTRPPIVGQFSLNLNDAEKGINVLTGPYGPEQSFTPAEFEKAMEFFVNHVENYRLFP